MPVGIDTSIADTWLPMVPDSSEVRTEIGAIATSGAAGFRLRDPSGFPGGITTAKLVAGAVPKAKLTVKGKGARLPAGLPLAVLQQFHPQIEKDVYDALSLRGSLNARNTLGGTAPAQVRGQIERHKGRLA